MSFDRVLILAGQQQGGVMMSSEISMPYVEELSLGAFDPILIEQE
jgi:hypothetical protein